MGVKIDDVIDVDDLKNLPKAWLETLTPANIVAKGYPFFLNADLTSFIMLFFDNLATIFGCINAMVFILGFTPDFIYSHMMGGACISFAWGNILYAFQASKVAMKTGKMDTCAQPYGINPPASFQKIFMIILPCFWGKLASLGKGPFVGGSPSDATPEELEEAMTFTWNVACCSNLIGGLMEFCGSFIAPMISRNVPEACFLVPLSGVGITYLGLLPYMQILEAQASGFPFVGMVPLIILWLGFFGAPPGVALFGKVPPVLVSCIVGVILFVIVNSEGYAQGWVAGAASAGQGGIQIPDFGGTFARGDFASNAGIGLTLGVSLTNFMGTFGCNISARLAGDTYSPMEMIQLDGLGTALGALLGSPFPTTTYIGHPIYKMLGATRGYSVVNGIVFLIIGLSGLFGIVAALFPFEVTVGQLACVGMIIVKQTFVESPPRWYPAVILGLALCFSDLMINPYVGGSNPAVMQIAVGYVFKSLCTSWALMMLIDRWFRAAACAFVFMAVLTCMGLQHSALLNFVYDENGHHSGAIPMATTTWKHIVTYAMCSAVCIIFWGLQMAGKILGPEEEDFRVLQRNRYSMAAVYKEGKETTSKTDEISVANA